MVYEVIFIFCYIQVWHPIRWKLFERIFWNILFNSFINKTIRGKIFKNFQPVRIYKSVWKKCPCKGWRHPCSKIQQKTFSYIIFYFIFQTILYICLIRNSAFFHFSPFHLRYQIKHNAISIHLAAFYGSVWHLATLIRQIRLLYS